jgi:hypothetical protein
LSRTFPAFQPDFCLLAVPRPVWRTTAVWRLLAQLFLGWLIWPALFVGLALWLGNLSLVYIIFGVAICLLVAVGVNVVLATAVSVAVGTVAAFIGGLVSGLISGFFINWQAALLSQVIPPLAEPLEATQLPPLLGGLGVGVLIPAVALGTVFGAASQMALTLAEQKQTHTAVQRIGGTLAGSLIAAALFGLLSVLPLLLLDNLAAVTSQTVVLTTAVGLGIANGLVLGWRTHRWLISFVLGGLLGPLTLLVGLLITQTEIQRLALRAACFAFECRYYDTIYYIGLALILLMVILAACVPYIVAYILGDKLAGPAAGAIAGLLGGSVAIVTLLIIFNPTQSNCVYPTICTQPPGYELFLGTFILTLTAALLTFTWNRWRNWLLYPLSLGWNLLLQQLDLRRWQRQSQNHSQLPKHTAFWDEHQRLRLYGLDEYVVWVCEHYPAEGAAALTFLNTSRQRWAAIAVQIELDARHLERLSSTVEGISRVHHGLTNTAELQGPASNLIRAFRRHSQDIEAALNQATPYHRRLALRGVEDRLDNLVRELTRSDEPYAERFYSIARRWHTAVSQHRHLLAATNQVQQEIDNPYIFGVPLNEAQEIFVGRRDISTRIEQLVLDPRRPPLLLYGQRRMGKTSLLRSLGRLLPSPILPLFVDGEGLAVASSYADFLTSMAWQMTQSASQQGVANLPELAELDTAVMETAPFTAFVKWLDGLEQRLKTGGYQMVLLTLDEFEAIDAVLNRGRFDAEDVMRMLRHLIQHRPFFKLLLAGSHTLREFQQWASYLINVQTIKVGYLSLDEARQLITAPIKGFALVYEPAAVARVLGLTHGHPHLVQLLCYVIVSLKNEQAITDRWLVTVADVDTAVDEALEIGSFFFADIEQNQADSVGVTLLNHIADQGEYGTATLLDLQERFGEEGLLALDHLLQRDLLEVTDDAYRFQVEMIRRWFAQRVGDSV